jgi:hypothetical protein
MNCERAAEFLPLYAAGDLDAARADEVASHVAACGDCRQVADEFSESRALLVEAFATPEFDAEFYSGIRSSVLEQISRDREPSTPSPVAALFGRRLAYATAFAVALFALAPAFQHFRGGRRETTPRELVITPPQIVDTPRPERRTDAVSPTRPDAVRNAPSPKLTYAAAIQRGGSTRRDATRDRYALTPEPAARDERDMIAQAPPSFNGAHEAGGPALPVAGSATSAKTNPAPEVSRIEIQTADPNIRIIWLAPPKSEAPDPNEPQNENGERK